MKRNFFSRLLHRGRKLFRGRRRRTWQTSPCFLGLEMLEDRRVMSAGFGGFGVFQHAAPLTIEITIQQPVVVSQSRVSVFSSSFSDASLASFLGALGLGSQSGNTGMSNTSLNGNSNSGGLLGGLLNPVTSTVGNLVDGVVAPVTSTVGSVVDGTLTTTQSPVTTTTSVLPVTLSLLPKLLSSPPQANPLPVSSPSVPVALIANVSAPAPIRTSATLSLSSGASSIQTILSAPDVPPSSETPVAPSDAAPVAPPAMPDPVPGTPALPPGAAQLMQSSALVPFVVPTNSAVFTSQTVRAENATTLPANAGPGRESAIDFALLLFGPSGSAVPAANFTAESQTSDAAMPGQNLDAGRAGLPLGGAAMSGAFADLETYVFADVGDVSADGNVPSATTEAPLSLGDHNDVTPPQAAGEAPTLIGVSDEILTRLVHETTQKITEAGKDLLKPSANHWMRYVAPLFMAAGAYFATRLTRRTKTLERRRKELELVP